ncbi:hypothetical protein ANCCAN_02285 [Ancylostoma caninum]|uniref:Lipoprotein n=1 Tax=Ancylostoma caninum TaxID=29170 RepID=A0A368H7B6_ANCCA|nr:hypothetical protein ANCCAN_02285 [Ancylostoma caninum]
MKTLMILAASCLATTLAGCPDMNSQIVKIEIEIAKIVAKANLTSMKIVDVTQQGQRHHFVELRMNYTHFYKWDSPFIKQLAPDPLRMDMSTYTRCNIKYYVGEDYLLGCINEHGCVFMRRFKDLTDKEKALLKIK